MNTLHKPKIVLLGAMSKMPVAGIVYLTTQYLMGLARLGYDVYYVEAHGSTPGILMQHAEDDAAARAADYIAATLGELDMGDRWCFQALHADGRCYGLSESALARLYANAGLIINLHGATTPRPEHTATGRLVYVGTDPVDVEVQVYHKNRRTIDYLAAHCAHFTWGENYGSPDCGVPVMEQFRLIPSRQPLILDWWQRPTRGSGPHFTTIGNWEQQARPVKYRGEVYTWSKHHEFMKVIDLPKRTAQSFELALSSFDGAAKRMLTERGWLVRPAASISQDTAAYRAYIAWSRGEFTVAKDQNVRLRSGWFSDRSAAYLAAGKPVITQETGFSNILPTGAGLFAFTTADEALAAVETVNADYTRHSAAAAEIARTHFSYDVVLPKMLAEVGM